MDYLVIDEKTLHKLQTFSHVEHMNEAVGIHKKMNRLTTTDRAILDVISRYACKYTGVCFLRKQLIAKKAGYKSRRTAIRSCQRLEQLGIIKQYETRRRAGDRRQAANLIVIQPVRSSGENSHTQDEQQIIAQENKFEQEHELAQNGLTQGQSHQTVTATSHPIKTSFKTPNEQKIQEDTYKETEKREICCDINEKDKSGTSNIIPDPWPDREKVQTVDTNDTLPYITNEETTDNKISFTNDEYQSIDIDSLIKESLSMRIPKVIYDALSPFFDGQTLYRIYGILLRAKASIDRNILLEDYGEDYVAAFYNVVRLYKQGRVRNLASYLYTTWNWLTADIYRQRYWEWLES